MKVGNVVNSWKFLLGIFAQVNDENNVIIEDAVGAFHRVERQHSFQATPIVEEIVAHPVPPSAGMSAMDIGDDNGLEDGGFEVASPDARRDMEHWNQVEFGIASDIEHFSTLDSSDTIKFAITIATIAPRGNAKSNPETSKSIPHTPE